MDFSNLSIQTVIVTNWNISITFNFCKKNIYVGKTRMDPDTIDLLSSVISILQLVIKFI